MTTRYLLRTKFYEYYVKDKRNEATPYKLICKGQEPQRFELYAEAVKEFHNFEGRAILTHNTDEKQTIKNYKYG